MRSVAGSLVPLGAFLLACSGATTAPVPVLVPPVASPPSSVPLGTVDLAPMAGDLPPAALEALEAAAARPAVVAPSMDEIVQRVFASYAAGEPVDLRTLASAELLVTMENGRLSADPVVDAQDFGEVKLIDTRRIGATGLEVTFENLGQRQTAFWTFGSLDGVNNIHHGADRSRGVSGELLLTDAEPWAVDGTLCGRDETLVAQCDRAEGKRASVCRTAADGLRYRTGTADELEVSLPSYRSPPVEITRTTTGDTTTTSFHIERVEVAHTLLFETKGTTTTGRLLIREDQRLLADETCRSTTLTEVEPIAGAAHAGLWGVDEPLFLTTVYIDELTLWDAAGTERAMTLAPDGQAWKGERDGCSVRLARIGAHLVVEAKDPSCPVSSGVYTRFTAP